MKSKIFCMALGLTLFVTGAAVAQQGGGQRTPPTIEQRLKRWNDNVFSKLDLKNDQQDKMNKIFTDYFTQQDSLRNSGQRPSREDMQKIGDERDTKVKAVLTDDQYKKYKEQLDLQMQQMRQRRGGNAGGAPQQPQ